MQLKQAANLAAGLQIHEQRCDQGTEPQQYTLRATHHTSTCRRGRIIRRCCLQMNSGSFWEYSVEQAQQRMWVCGSGALVSALASSDEGQENDDDTV